MGLIVAGPDQFLANGRPDMRDSRRWGASLDGGLEARPGEPVQPDTPQPPEPDA